MYDINDYKDKTLYDEQGEKIGKVEDVFIDEATGKPEWLLIDNGFLSPQTLVPCSRVSRSEGGLVSPFGSDQVKSAPGIDKDADTITTGDERKLYDYYGIPYSKSVSSSILPEGESVEGTSGRQSVQTGTSGEAGTSSQTGTSGEAGTSTTRVIRYSRTSVGTGYQGSVPLGREERTGFTEPLGGVEPVGGETAGRGQSESDLLGEDVETDEEIRRQRLEEQLREQQGEDESKAA